MVLPEACSTDEKAAGVHDIAGPLLVGGVDYLIPRTALFRDRSVRPILDSQQRFEGYLEFRDQACKIAATQLVSMIKSPTDLLLATKDDEELFAPIYATYMAFRDQKTLLGDQGDGTLDGNIPNCYKGDVKLFKDMFSGTLNHVRGYFAYRKGLLKLDFIKWDSDPEEVLKWLKTSTRWSELGNHDLRRGLSHMHLLKELKTSNVNLLELENIALEKINLELSSELEDYVGRYDSMLADHYFERMRYMNLARACSTEAQMTGIIFLEEALPIRSFSKEQMLSRTPNIWRSPSVSQTMKQAFQDSMGSLGRVKEGFRTRVAGWRAIPVFMMFTLFSALGNRNGS
ncbi:unnamed protein product [Urochloa decumbens]|uniref:Uncharacterized protein n=1 Tax=Urochloa decumbens TaxID=240449 RepID=A0ABC9EEC4_9POAL